MSKKAELTRKRKTKSDPKQGVYVARDPALPKGYPYTQLSCSFCGKTQREAKVLIAGPTVYICDECVALSASIIDERKAEEMMPGAGEALAYADFAIPGLPR